MQLAPPPPLRDGTVLANLNVPLGLTQALRLAGIAKEIEAGTLKVAVDGVVTINALAMQLNVNFPRVEARSRRRLHTTTKVTRLNLVCFISHPPTDSRPYEARISLGQTLSRAITSCVIGRAPCVEVHVPLESQEPPATAGFGSKLAGVTKHAGSSVHWSTHSVHSFGPFVG